jgi:hypothetical protein
MNGAHAGVNVVTDAGREIDGQVRARRSYLLRCWQEPGVGAGGAPAWRFTLSRLDDSRCETPFVSLEDVYEQLLEELAHA